MAEIVSETVETLHTLTLSQKELEALWVAIDVTAIRFDNDDQAGLAKMICDLIFDALNG